MIQAADSGAPRQISTVLLIVSITDINDNVPVFSQTNYTAQVQVRRNNNIKAYLGIFYCCRKSLPPITLSSAEI